MTAQPSNRHLDELIGLARRMEYADIEARLLSHREIMAASHCRIALAGETGIGRSAQINRDLLAENLLPLKRPTVVPIEICHGPIRRMAVFPYFARPDFRERPKNGKRGMSASPTMLEGPPEIVDDPGPADICRFTTADTPAERERIVQATARARMTLPTLFPTDLAIVIIPGVGEMNRATVTSRYRILPACDRILFMLRAATPSPAERRFLESPVFSNRDVRILPPGSLLFSIVLAAAEAVRAQRAAEIGRRLAEQAELVRARCGVEWICLGKPLDERRSIEDELRRAEAAVRLRQRKINSALKNDLAALETRMSDTFREGLKAVTKDLRAPVFVDGTVDGLSRQLETAMDPCAKEMMTALRSLGKRYAAAGRKLLAPWESMVRRMLADPNVPTVPTPFALRAEDIAAFSGLNPFQFLGDILPVIADLSPGGSGSILQRLAEVSEEMPHHMERIFRPVAEMFPAQWEDAVNGRIGAVRQGFSAATTPAASDRRTLLAEGLAAFAPDAVNSDALKNDEKY